MEPIEILRLFFDRSLLKLITDDTNEYASQKLAEGKRSGAAVGGGGCAGRYKSLAGNCSLYILG